MSPAIADLVARARSGDQGAWHDLVDRFAPLVWSVCTRFELSRQQAEEVGQNVWLALIENLSSLREPAALPGWLATTTRRECLHVAKRARRRREHEVTFDDWDLPEPDATDVATDVAADLLRAERDDALREAFDQLPPNCRELIGLLAVTPRLPYVEIARRLETKVGSIGPTRQRCLHKLRECPVLASWLRENAAEAGRSSV